MEGGAQGNSTRAGGAGGPAETWWGMRYCCIVMGTCHQCAATGLPGEQCTTCGAIYPGNSTLAVGA